jgi:hypothetical protein
MAPANFISIVKTLWQKRLVRILVAVFVLGGAVYGQYRLARIPLPVDVETSKAGYTPVIAALFKREMLVVQEPSRQSADEAQREMLLADDGSEAVTVETHFQSARLHDDITTLLVHANKSVPSPGPHQIVYSTEGEAESSAIRPHPFVDRNAKPCQTAIHISLAEKNRIPTELQFYQTDGPGALHNRAFAMKAMGADLVVELLTRNLAANFQGPGCTKTILVGDWSHTFASPVPLKIILPAGTTVEFWFTPLLEKPPWQGPDGVFEAFELEALPIAVSSISNVANNIQVFNAKPAKPTQPLLLKRLLIGSSELQLHYAGEALVKENGNYAVTFNIWEFVKSNPLLAGILAMLDAALLEWIRRIVFK